MSGSGRIERARSVLPGEAAPLPIIDVAPLLAPDAFSSADLGATIDVLRAACTGPGFFYVRNHGVPGRLDEQLLGLARRFFALPVDQKLEIENLRSPHFRGYTRVGQELTAGAPDVREQLDVGTERPALGSDAQGPLFLRLRGPNQWPRALPELQHALTTWAATLERVSIALTRALALVLGQKASHFDPAFLPESDSHLKVIRYPGARDESRQGVGPHKDYGLLTLVLQDETVGLQVEAEGRYIDIPPISGTLVANLGEMFEVATGGYLRATRHRVRSPEAGTDRLSLAYFFCPRLEAVFGDVTLPAALQTGSPSVAADPTNPIYAEFGQNALRGWVRSHPEVARKFYPELVRDGVVRFDG